MIISLLRPCLNVGQFLPEMSYYHLRFLHPRPALPQYLVTRTLQLSKIRLRAHFIWLFWLHNNTNIHLNLRQIECYFIRLFPFRSVICPQMKYKFSQSESINFSRCVIKWRKH